MPENITAFVRLHEIRHVDLRLLGPHPQEAAVAVDPLVAVDKPVGGVQSFIAAICGPDAEALDLLEVALPVGNARTAPGGLGEVVRAALPARGAILQSLAEGRDSHRERVELGQTPLTAILLYCRKRRRAFAARTAASEDAPLSTAAASVEELIAEQGRVAKAWPQFRAQLPLVAERIAESHPCCGCTEVDRCYPAGGGHAFANDRLAQLNAAAAPLDFEPLGAWRLREAAEIIGGSAPREIAQRPPRDETELGLWRSRHADGIERSSPPRLLVGESEGRELLEVARVKLTLLADLLAQLDSLWRATKAPHGVWTDESVRVAWGRPGAVPAAIWGFRPRLRLAGLVPLSPHPTPDGKPLPQPPRMSDPTLLPTEVVDAMRVFDEPRKATLFVKRGKQGTDGFDLTALLEELNLPWEPFRVADAMHVRGEAWEALLAPLATRDKNDGAGLPFGGRATGKTAALKTGEQIDKVECRWRPRFGPAVDLHALGMLLFETLLRHDEWTPAGFRAALAQLREELTRTTLALPIEQREAAVQQWVASRSEVDAPGAAWSRRNLLHSAKDRAATRLDAFPASLWQAIIAFGVRLTTWIPGFSFCDDRTAEPPRLAGELLAPLVELRGLIALLDDALFGRTTPRSAVRDKLNELRR